MSIPSSWLSAESERWIRERIITPEQAARIRALYPAPSRTGWGLVVFSSLGAAVVGLGVILLLAYNWHAMPKGVKLGLVFGTITVSHALGWWWRSRPGSRSFLAEGVSLFGSMAYGAGIWLVAQIYHIQEHFPNGFLFWGLGVLPLAWIWRSVPQALLATVVFTIWGCAEAGAFDRPLHLSAIVLFVGIAPLAWVMRSGILMAGVVVALYVQLLVNAASWSGGGSAFLTALGFSSALIGLGILAGRAESASAPARVMRFLGTIGYLVTGFILSFSDASRALFLWGSADEAAGAVAYHGVAFGVALVLWGGLIWRTWRQNWREVRVEEWLFPVGLLVTQAAATSPGRADAALVAITFNLVLLGLAAMWVVRGCRSGRLAPVVVGSLLLGAVIFARYFDLFDNLVARGIAFLVFGGILFAEATYFRRTASSAPARTASP